MATPSDQTPAATERRETPRIRLARLATEAALAQPEVTGLDGGIANRHTTFVGTSPLPGVVVTADEDRYAIDLYLTAAPTDLHALGQTVTTAVDRAARAAELGDAVGTVHVTFTDLTIPDRTPQR